MPNMPDVSTTTVESNCDETGNNNICEIDVEYDKFVRGLANRRDRNTFSNESCSHALSILRCVFDFSEKEVDIFSGELASRVYNDKILLKSAEKFLADKKGKLRILLQNNVPPARASTMSDFLNFSLKYPDNCKVRIVNDEHGLKNSNTHFLVADSRAYRIELDISEHTAICCFEDKDFASELNEVFDTAWDSKFTDLPIPQQT